MTANPLGPGVSRFLDPKDRQFAAAVFEFRKPPLDAELNLVSFVDAEARAEEVRSRVPSGWLMNESDPMADYSTDPLNSNQLHFGRNLAGEVRNLCWAVVNGWLVPVTGTRTGSPPLASNDADCWNRVALSPPPSVPGSNQPEFVFLEAWLARIDVDPPTSTAPGKPQRGFLWRYGNLEGGYSFLADDLVDPAMNFETTRRVQVQYRIRTVPNVGLGLNPEGFDPAMVFAQGLLAAPSAIPFANMRQALGDPGLWRAGTGDPDTFGTADGYVYAIPVCAVFRRNQLAFGTTNLTGAFNRNSAALSRDDALAFTGNAVIPAGGITDASAVFTLASVTGTAFQTMVAFADAYFRVDDEIVHVTSVVQTSPTAFNVSIDRAQLGTVARAHLAGAALTPYTVRPDGLFSDQVARSDVLDLRHSVADKFDYASLLRTNLIALLKGRLCSAWKRYGDPSGPVILGGDMVTDSGISPLTALDAPDGNRRAFSDCVTVQRFNVPVTVPGNGTALHAPVQFDVAPFTAEVTWDATPPVHVAGNRLSGGVFPSWWNGDLVTVQLAPFQAGLPGADADQVRFMLPSEDPDAVIVRFEGMTTDPNGGDPASVLPTSPTATNPYLTAPVPTGELILKSGQGLTVALDGSGNLTITLQSGTADTELREFLDALQGNTGAAYVQQLVMHVEFAVVWGAGRGLSHRPDFVHAAHYTGSPATRTLVRDGVSSGSSSRMVPTYLGDSPYAQTGVDRALSRTSEVMVDPGSKTVWIAPYRTVQIPALMCRSAAHLNWYGVGPTYQGCMPPRSLDGSAVVHAYVDPLDLFWDTGSGRYVEVPMDYLPLPGLHHVPIVPVSNTLFSSGINFLLMAKEGAVANTSDYNRNLVSYPAAAGYYIVTSANLVTEPYGSSSGALSIFGEKYTNSKLTSAAGGPFRGVKFPPFLAPARITGIYLRSGAGVTPGLGSPFDTNRVFTGAPGTDVNLMHDSFDGPTFLLDVDANGDLYFVLNADVIDLSKAPAGTTFDTSYFLVECVLFGFDRGFLQTNGRLVGANITSAAEDQFTDSTDGTVGLVVPAPLTTGSANNEVAVYYSRSPYQGDPFGTQTSYTDTAYRQGGLSLSDFNTLLASPLGPVSTLLLPNRAGYEVVAAESFTTSLGTGRLSGSVPLPLLEQVAGAPSVSAPLNPPDYAGTRVDLQRRFSVSRVGYEDWAAPKFPVASAAWAARPALRTSALSEAYDHGVHPELAGCVARLPLGALFCDKDFVGKTLYQARNQTGIGSIPVGAFSFVPFEASMAKAAEGRSTWEGVEYVCGNASGTVGAGAGALVRVDGTTTNPADTQVFKTTRGGAAYSATGPWPGGIVSVRMPKARPNVEAGAVMTATAYLVRSAPETVGGFELHAGHELQMVVVTHAIPAYFRDTDIVHSANGTNEGYTAVDRFRLYGKPLEKRRGEVDASVLPTDKPLFQNRVLDDPLYFGSSDVPPVSQWQEALPVTVDGQTAFALTHQPLDPAGVMLFLNGLKLDYGVDYTIGGPSSQVVTYVPSVPPDFSNPSLVTTDTLVAFYLLF